MRTALVFALLLLLAATGLVVAGDAAALPLAISPKDPHVGYSGRWDQRDAAGPKAQWSACIVRLRFKGTAINAVLGGPKENAFAVFVDGKPTSTIQLADGQSVYEAASGLAAGEHTVELYKRTEPYQGTVQFKGFQLAQGSTTLEPEKITRRIEFLGDSITCGYGNEGADRGEHFKPQTENAAMAWGAIAARALKADLMCEAVSGIWLMDTGKNDPLPKRWERVMMTDAGNLWNFSSWTADVVVVNLGTNDGNKPIDEKLWDDAYRAFITSIRSHYPKCHVFLTIGAMGHGPKDCLIGYNDRLAAAYAKDGDTKIHAVALANQKDSDGIGSDWHPSVKTHQIMADTLVAAVKKELGW